MKTSTHQTKFENRNRSFLCEDSYIIFAVLAWENFGTDTNNLNTKTTNRGVTT
jgi:hypothetical protein